MSDTQLLAFGWGASTRLSLFSPFFPVCPCSLARHVSLFTDLAFLRLDGPSLPVLGECFLLGSWFVYQYGLYLLQFDMHPGCEHIVELQDELADLDNQATRLERELAAVQALVV